MSDEKIKEMANLLTSGATMLAKPCPKCGSPLFRTKGGEVLCPSCGFKPDLKEEEKEPSKAQVAEQTNGLQMALRGKLRLLVEKLNETEDPHEIKELVDTIKAVLDVMKQATQ